MNDSSYTNVLKKEQADLANRIQELEGELRLRRDQKRAIDEKLGGAPGLVSGPQRPLPEALPDSPVIRVVREIMLEHTDAGMKDAAILDEAMARGFTSESKNPRQTIYWALRQLQTVGLVKRVGKGFWIGLEA